MTLPKCETFQQNTQWSNAKKQISVKGRKFCGYNKHHQWNCLATQESWELVNQLTMSRHPCCIATLSSTQCFIEILQVENSNFSKGQLLFTNKKLKCNIEMANGWNKNLQSPSSGNIEWIKLMPIICQNQTWEHEQKMQKVHNMPNRQKEQTKVICVLNRIVTIWTDKIIFSEAYLPLLNISW